MGKTDVTIADWGAAYRQFVRRMKFLGRWPFPSREEKKEAWREWCELNIFLLENDEDL